MKTTFRFSLIATATLVLSACGSLDLGIGEPKQDEVSPHSATATQFDRFLSEGYRRLARREDREHDFTDTELYSKRADHASSGRLVIPYTFEDKSIPLYAVADLEEARKRLDDAFYKGASVKVPQEAATAQVMFDCWMEQQEEDIQPHHIAECRGRFEEAMATVEAALSGGQKPVAVDAPVEEVECVKPAEVASNLPQGMAPTLPGPFVVYFDLKSAQLTPQALEIILEASQAVKEYEATHLIVKGHTDTSGTRKYNEELSSRRVASVMDALRLAGVGVDLIDASHYGETAVKVVTGDGVRNAQNRRVEIQLGR